MSDLRDDEAGALSVGPTDLGMVRFIIETRDGRLELDFEPDEAIDIADELMAAAQAARERTAPKRSGGSEPSGPGQGAAGKGGSGKGGRRR